MNVRPMNPEESRETRGVARRCFGAFAMIFFDFGAQTLVCEEDGRILGGASLGRFSAGSRDRGVVKWIFTAPDAQGRGVANRLLAAAMAWFDEAGCTDVFACIEGYNTASSNRFFDAGFRPMGFRDQIARFGSHLPRVWLKSFHVLDVGHFLWVRTPEAPLDDIGADATDDGTDDATAASQLLAWAATVVLNAAILALVTIRTEGPGELSPERLLSLLIAVALLVGVRTVAMLLTARMVQLPMRYRPWETGLLLSGIVGAAFGGIFPIPGSVYPRSLRWRYRDLLPKLGPVAAVGAGELVSLGWVLWVLTRFVDPAVGWYGLLTVAAALTRVMLVFDVVLPVFPLVSYNGRRVLDWKPGVWALLAAASVALLLVSAVAQ